MPVSELARSSVDLERRLVRASSSRMDWTLCADEVSVWSRRRVIRSWGACLLVNAGPVLVLGAGLACAQDGDKHAKSHEQRRQTDQEDPIDCGSESEGRQGFRIDQREVWLATAHDPGSLERVAQGRVRDHA